MSDEWDTRRPVPTRHEIGADLSAISVDELGERIAALRVEIERLKAEISRKRASLEAAAGAFRM